MKLHLKVSLFYCIKRKSSVNLALKTSGSRRCRSQAKSLQECRDKSFSCYTTFVELITDNLAAGAGTYCAPRVKISIQGCFFSDLKSVSSQQMSLNGSGLQNKLLDQNNDTISTHFYTLSWLKTAHQCPQQASVLQVPIGR